DSSLLGLSRRPLLGHNDRVRFSRPFRLSFPRSTRGRVAVGAALVVVLGLAGIGLWLRFNPTASVVAGKVPLDTARRVTSDVPRHVEPPAPSPSPSLPPSPAAQGRAPRTGGGGLPAYAPPGEHGLWPPDGTP